MNSNNISFNVSFRVSTTRKEIKRQLQRTGYRLIEPRDIEIEHLTDQIAEAFVDGDYQHAFLDGGGRFDPLRDDGAYLQYIIEWVLELYLDSRE